MPEEIYDDLSKRERQIMDIIHRLGEASVGEVIEELSNPPGYNSIRMLMNILEEKGHLKHRNEKNKYFYSATLQKEVVKKSALNHLLSTYFNRSVPEVMSTLLSQKKISAAELEELSNLIKKAKAGDTRQKDS